MQSLRKVSLSKKFGEFSDHWSPKIIGEVNGQHIQAVKLKGTLTMRLRDGDVIVSPANS